MASIVCPNGCDSLLPPVNFDKCSPKVSLSEIVRIFLGKPNSAPFTDWKTATEWTTRLSQSAVEDMIRPLTVIADKPAGSQRVKEISNSRKITLGVDNTVNIEIDDISDENYEFMRVTQCGGKYKMWYETAGGHLYGGNEGIDATVFLDNVLARGKDEIEKITGTATWSSKFSPERTVSPIAEL